MSKEQKGVEGYPVDMPGYTFTHDLLDYPPLPDSELQHETFDEWLEAYDDVGFLALHSEPERAARRVNLPENSSWHDIFKYVNDQHRRHYARECNASEDATWDKLSKNHPGRISEIAEYERTTRAWKESNRPFPVEIKGHSSDEFREQVSDILYNRQESTIRHSWQPTWLEMLTRHALLGLTDYSPESIAKRMKDIREFVLDKVAQGESDNPFNT